MGLRNRIMLLVAIGLVAATVPVGVMGLAMVRAATDRVLEERLATAQTTAAHLDDRLVQGWGQLDQLGARASGLWNGADPAMVRREFALLVPQMPLFSGGVVLFSRDGRTLLGEPSTVLQRLPRPSHQSVMAAVMQTGKPSASRLTRSGGGDTLVLMAVPVFTGSEEAVGVLIGIVDLTAPTLLTFINGLALGRSGHAVIVDSDGTVLASTQSEELFTREEHPQFFGALIAGGRPLVSRAEESTTAGGRRETHVMAFAPLAAMPWGLGIGQDEAETFGPIRRLRDRVIGFEALALLAALAFAWLDTSAVVGPLRVLQRAAERIAGGDLAHPVQVRRTDEVGHLGRSFETMRTQLQQSREENVRLQERLLSVVMLEERERIAREMHDSVGQVLGYVNTKVQAVRALLEAGHVTEARRQLEQLEGAARDVYADLREAILSLRTAPSAERRLIPALQEYVQRFSELSGITVTLDADAPVTLNPTTELHLNRIVQEALTNVRKHARAKQAWVRVRVSEGVLAATVTDDGVGFGPAGAGQPGTAGFGLQTMRERAEAIGAAITVRSTKHEGTTVEVRLPLDEGGTADARAAGG